jgi:hypothetical protein
MLELLIPFVSVRSNINAYVMIKSRNMHSTWCLIILKNVGCCAECMRLNKQNYKDTFGMSNDNIVDVMNK